MNVRNQRNPDSFLDGGNGGGGFVVRQRNPDDFAPGFFKGFNLSDGRLDISGVGVGHGLYNHRSIAADCHAPEMNLFCFFPSDKR
ncbi:MAG: hypothetical protein BWX55_00579 [Deltaproteobacteria bacterium ADurb.Bin022]|nr:MAG: hypothetical protein BWX55_00579 [Deltaproteobacteria bacterium ADurb.Bin022]